ncbi:TPA: SMI1/KNR4 family protein [Stenotrophomonas maltophilia]|uniref:SMI1/KNR4 family protein n=1 Tax=Stenotrophomonas maltophilia TaxID=40324 RepID=UPI0021D8523A|nr:SMI1/KNR4 family protein [Stenotrophomonas maltophilia]UXY47816.1 SMI1/KNR4 family protein [Stenotrophomonas maltophilia]
MHTLAEIELATGQTFPALYHRLDTEDRLSWGATHPQWAQVCLSELQPVPPILLYAQDYEPLERGELLEAWQELTAEDHYNPLRQDLQLLPFARTGAGDSYCFWTNAPGCDEPPVLLVWHDDDRADVLARNLQDFLFRKMVEAVADYEAPYTLLSHGDLADNLQRWLGSHRAWLRDDQATALEALFARSAEIEQGEIDEDQAQALVQQLIGFERLDESFAYVR